MRERSRFERELSELEVAGGAPARYFAGEAGGPVVKLTHFHVRKFLDLGTKALTPDPDPGVMTPTRMAVGYVLPADPRRQALQSALTALVTARYSSALSPTKPLRIAIADLTGAKQHAPVFAGISAFGANSEMEGASLPKILALYAVHQLRFDLDTFAARNKIDKASVLRSAIVAEWKKEGLRSTPNLTGLFKFVEKAGSPVTAQLHKTHDVHHNSVARALILALGFEYIGSVALQSGLFDQAHGGLWLNAAYNRPAVTWTRTPFPRLQRHNATALGAASFFVLLAQGRLVNQSTSKEIGDALAKHMCMGSSGLLDGIQALGGVQSPSPNKCGDDPPFIHDAIHVIREVSPGKRIEYAVAVLSKKPPVVYFTVLGQDLDRLIVAANP